MWVVMVQHKTSDQYQMSGKVPTRSRRYRLLKTFNILSNAKADAVVTAIALLYFRTGKLKRIGSKTTEKRWRHCFRHYKSMGGFVAMEQKKVYGCFWLPWKPEFWSNLPKNQGMQPFPQPSDATHKIDQDWPTGFRAIQVWKCGWQRTDDGPLVYYKLTLWAFGSGELKIRQFYSACGLFIYILQPCLMV